MADPARRARALSGSIATPNLFAGEGGPFLSGRHASA